MSAHVYVYRYNPPPTTMPKRWFVMLVLNVLLFCSGCLSLVREVKVSALDVHVANERRLLGTGTPNKLGSKGIINPRPQDRIYINY